VIVKGCPPAARYSWLPEHSALNYNVRRCDFVWQLPFCFSALLFAPASIRGEQATVCDFFPDLKSYHGRSVKGCKPRLFLDDGKTAIAANCDEPFIAESLVWATALQVDPGPTLVPPERLQLERARQASIASRRSNRHARITALLEGTVETKDKYPWSHGAQGSISHAYGAQGQFPARLILTRISDLSFEILPDAEDLQVIDVCEVFADLTAYNEKRVAIRGEIRGGYHGAAMYGRNCEKSHETDGYRWPTALYFGVPFHDSRFVQPLMRDLQQTATTYTEAGKLIRGRQNVRATYTAVGVVHTRQQ